MSDFFENFETQSFAVTSPETKSQLSFSLFNGGFSLSVWAAKNSGQRGPVYRKPLNDDLITLFKKYIKKMAQASPGQRFPIVINKWDVDNKKYVKDCAITFFKDDKQVNTISIEYVDNSGRSAQETFPLKAMGGISLSSEPMSDAERSNLKTETMLCYLIETVPVARVITKRKYTGNRGGNNNNNTGGGNNNNNSGGSNPLDF